MSIKYKRGIIMFFMILLVLGTVSAQEVVTTDGSEGGTFDLGFIQRSVNLIVGAFAGGYLLIKVALDIFHAVKNSAEDSNALKRAIGNFIMNVMIIAGFMFVINYVIGGLSHVDENTNITTADVKDVFFAVLSGAEVTVPLL